MTETSSLGEPVLFLLDLFVSQCVLALSALNSLTVQEKQAVNEGWFLLLVFQMCALDVRTGTEKFIVSILCLKEDSAASVRCVIYMASSCF